MLEAQTLYEYWIEAGATSDHGQNLLKDCENGQPQAVGGLLAEKLRKGEWCG